MCPLERCVCSLSEFDQHKVIIIEGTFISSVFLKATTATQGKDKKWSIHEIFESILLGHSTVKTKNNAITIFARFC